MKNDKKVNLKNKADECRRMAEDECSNFNYVSECEAIEEFDQGETARYFRENARYVIGLLVERLEAARKGAPEESLRTYDAETLARLLTADAYPEYESKSYDEDLSDEETIKRWENGNLISDDGMLYYATTDASVQQSQLQDVLLDYAMSAAVYAKHIHSSSIDAWVEIIDIIHRFKERCAFKLKSEDALRIIDLEKSAAHRLRLDKIIAELPPYKKAKEPKKTRKTK